jgi:hypothetical protein
VSTATLARPPVQVRVARLANGVPIPGWWTWRCTTHCTGTSFPAEALYTRLRVGEHLDACHHLPEGTSR